MAKTWFILLAISIASFSCCYGQNYYHSPNDTLTAYTSLDAPVTMNITQIHPNNDTLHFNWNKLDVNIPFGWEANICDNSNCYTSLIDSGTTLPVLPGDNGLMLIHCTPHVNEGTAIIRYTISEENTPLQIDTLTWIINATFAGLNQLTGYSPKIWADKSELHIEDDLKQFNSFVLYNSYGSVVFEKDMNQEKIVLTSLSPAVYFIKLIGETSIYCQQIILFE